jgi:transcriptional regulator with XRE-family HTH domain
MDLGQKLKSVRKLRDMTLEDLSKRSGVSRSYITNIENGRKTEVSSRIMEALSTALGISSDYFRIQGAALPTDCIPDLSPEIVTLLSHSESLPFLKLTQKAIDNGLSAETVEAVIDAIISAQQKKRGGTSK